MGIEVGSGRIVFESRPFDVEELDVKIDQEPRKFVRLRSRDWVNVLPVTTNGQAVMIQQFRYGAKSQVLEIPGGEVDVGEKDPTLAAARELEEETGFVSSRFLSLGSINPNPALMNNRCHFFLALGCQLNPNRQHFPDENERIEVVLKPVKDLEHMLRTGQIDHCLACLNIMMSRQYLRGFLESGESTFPR